MAEPAGRRPSSALFEDGGPYSWEKFREVFFETEDIYEYRAAIKLVGSWDEWLRLKRDSPTFKRTIEKWVTELKVQLQSDSFLRILTMSKGENGLSAAKWIIEQTNESKPKAHGRGRPTKQEVQSKTVELARESVEEQAELERVKAATLTQ